MVQHLSVEVLVGALVASWLLVFFLLAGLGLLFLINRNKHSFRYPLAPLEETHRGLRRMVEEAEWLDGERLILAVRHVALAREAVERAARACGRSVMQSHHVPTTLVHALDEGVEILGGSSAVLTFTCACGQQQSAMIQFPRAGGRPESTDHITISATPDWRTMGFTVNMPCKRCKKLQTKKYLYDPLPV